MINAPLRNNKSQTKNIVMLIIIIAIGFALYFVLNAPAQRTDGQKIGNAIDQMSNGVDKAARELQPRTLGDKLDDAAQDAANKMKQ